MRRSRLKIFLLYFAPQFSVYTKFGIDPCEVHRCIYLSQQMLLRHQLVYDYELYQISIHFPVFQHLASPLPILPYLSEKAQLQPDFFDRLKPPGEGGFFILQSPKSLRLKRESQDDCFQYVASEKR